MNSFSFVSGKLTFHGHSFVNSVSTAKQATIFKTDKKNLKSALPSGVYHLWKPTCLRSKNRPRPLKAPRISSRGKNFRSRHTGCIEGSNEYSRCTRGRINFSIKIARRGIFASARVACRIHCWRQQPPR